MISARAGHDESIDQVKQGFVDGYVTKEEYANTLRAYQNEMKSDARDAAVELKALYKELDFYR